MEDSINDTHIYVHTSKANAFGLPACLPATGFLPPTFRIPSQACWDHCTKSSAAASSTDAVHGELLLKLSSSLRISFCGSQPSLTFETSLVPGWRGKAPNLGRRVAIGKRFPNITP